MKYIANFALKHNTIKSDYRSTFVSFFKKALSDYMGGRFYDQYYGPAPIKKNLCWSVKLKDPKFVEDKIELGEPRIQMTLKSTDLKTATLYFSALLGMKRKNFAMGMDNALVLTSIRMVPEREVSGDFAVFKLLSPLCIRCHDRETNHDRYLTVDDEEFEQAVKQKLKEELGDRGGAIDALEFDFSKLKKIVLPVYGVMIDCTIGIFLVKGDTHILNEMHQGGIGSRRSSGFGLIESVY